MECESPFKAPADCLQYHTGPTGTFSSFNYGNVMITSTFYTICIRQELGNCNIQYSVNKLDNDEEFILSNSGQKNARISKVGWNYEFIDLDVEVDISYIFQRTDGCGNAQIHIPLDPYSSIFCGSYFNQGQSNVNDGCVFCKFWKVIRLLNWKWNIKQLFFYFSEPSTF